ncbi:MAG: type II toxin-antitoxin system VapC family toxin [Terracidiphilus sp.]|jgi:PIN domain nuclease of toxin-antitoxin system
MKVLLDTHTLLWAAFRKDLLSPRARKLIQSSTNEILVSAASAWEIATKYRLGKLPHAQVLVEDFIAKVTSAGYVLLSISVEHALRAGRLPADHKDPFDRMLAAQAIHEDLLLLSNDLQLDAFGVRREW